MQERGRGVQKDGMSPSCSPQRPKVYICMETGCKKAYSRPSLLEQHMRSHNNNRPFVCGEPNCADSFTRKDHLERHMLKHLQDKDKPFHCSICQKGVNSQQHLKRHEKTHFKSFKCTYEGCTEAFYKHQSLKSHISQIHEDGANKHKCQICDKTFSRPNRLKDHMEKHHNNESKLMCDFPDCFQSFHVWSALQLHIKNEHPRIQCPICKKKVIGSKGLANHMKVHDDHTVIKIWKCMEPKCESKFQKKEYIVKHYAHAHPLVSLPNELLYGNTQTGEALQLTPNSLDDGSLTPKSPSEHEKFDFLVASPSASKSLQYSHLVTAEAKSKRVRESASWKRAPDPLELLMNNVDTRLTCPYISCKNMFPTQKTLDKHLATIHAEQNEAKRPKLE